MHTHIHTRLILEFSSELFDKSSALSLLSTEYSGAALKSSCSFFAEDTHTRTHTDTHMAPLSLAAQYFCLKNFYFPKWLHVLHLRKMFFGIISSEAGNVYLSHLLFFFSSLSSCVIIRPAPGRSGPPPDQADLNNAAESNLQVQCFSRHQLIFRCLCVEANDP